MTEQVFVPWEGLLSVVFSMLCLTNLSYYAVGNYA
jgi:hypothetical protein